MSYYAPQRQSREESFDEVLDLHGFTTSEARIVIDDLVRDRAGNVRLIVGKGLRSEFVPVLPSFVANYLTQKGIMFDDSVSGVIDAKFG